MKKEARLEIFVKGALVKTGWNIVKAAGVKRLPLNHLAGWVDKKSKGMLKKLKKKKKTVKEAGINEPGFQTKLKLISFGGHRCNLALRRSLFTLSWLILYYFSLFTKTVVVFALQTNTGLNTILYLSTNS